MLTSGPDQPSFGFAEEAAAGKSGECEIDRIIGLLDPVIANEADMCMQATAALVNRDPSGRQARRLRLIVVTCGARIRKIGELKAALLNGGEILVRGFDERPEGPC